MAAAFDNIEAPCKLKLLKWKVKKESHVFKGTVLALYCDSNEDSVSNSKKLKAIRAGVVTDIPVKEGTVANKGDVVLTLSSSGDKTCAHPTIMKDMCAECGMDLRENLGLPGDRKASITASVAMVHSIPELIVSQEQAMEIGKEDENRLLKQRKLVLLVDLDQTLIHTTNDNIPPNLKDVKHFQLWHGKTYIWYHTRFRPFTQRFIEAVSKMYELHICTFGVRMYAHIIARLLDPDEKYFSHRILSRDECFDAMSKTANLKALFPCGDKTVCIIDDREDVWNFAPNLVHVKPYRFFQGTADINAPPGLTKKEHDSEPLSHKVVDPKETESEDGKPFTGGTAGKDSKDVDQTNTGNGGVSGDSQPHTIIQDSRKDVENSSSENSLKSSSNCGEARDVDQRDRQDDKTEIVPNLFLNTEGDKLAERDMAANGEIDEAVKIKDVHSAKTTDQNSSTDSKEETKSNKGKNSEEKQEIEWDDTDDYLLHLEEILTRIHTAFYDMYEQSQSKGSIELPDLKSIVPYVRKKVLKGANIVFSGMVPLNMPMEKSRAYIVATALGATIQTDIVVSKTKTSHDPNATTHLVAAKSGTGKHKAAMKVKGLRIVNGGWIWACNERWEWVDEKLFPLNNPDVITKTESCADEKDFSAKRKSHKRKHNKKEEHELDKDLDIQEASENAGIKKQKVTASSTESDCAEVSGANTETNVSPVCTFTDEEIMSMDKEVDLFLEGEDDDDSSDETDNERDKRIRKNVLGSGDDSDSDSDSLSGDYPRGWNLRRRSSQSPQALERKQDRTDGEEEEGSENELDLEQYDKKFNAFTQDDSSSSNSGDSIGSVNDEIAEALEKEFLGSL